VAAIGTGGQCRPARQVAHSFVRRIDAPGDDVLHLIAFDADPLAGAGQHYPKQIIEPNMRQGTAVSR